MLNKKNKILAIDPGTRVMGFAFFENEKLIHFGVKTFPKTLSPHETLKEGKSVILRLIQDFNPNVLVYEKAFFANNRTAKQVMIFADEIGKIGKRKKLEVKSFAPSSVKKCITGYGNALKEDVARVVVSKYPELRVYLTQDKKWKEIYHQNMFDAVAVGLLVLRKSFKI